MCPDIMENVTGYLPAHTPGVLPEYTRYRITGEEYPGMVPSPGGKTPGIVYLDVSKEGLARLDQFEGDLYQRETVDILLPDGRSIEADTYVVKPEHHACLKSEAWDFETFLKEGKPAFTCSYGGYDALAQKDEPPC